MSEVKKRTITITGPFSEDKDGDLKFEHPTSGSLNYVEVSWIKTWPGVTVTVEDAPRELPTEPGALIRATVADVGIRTADRILRLADIDSRPWLDLASGKWFSPSEVRDDWVELVPATS